MSYTLVNLTAFLVGCLFFYSGYHLVRHGREDLTLFLVSSGVGLGLIVVAVYPALFSTVADVIGLELRARAILVVSNITLFLLVVFLFNRLKGLYDKISLLNEEVSLLRSKVEQHEE